MNLDGKTSNAGRRNWFIRLLVRLKILHADEPSPPDPVPTPAPAPQPAELADDLDLATVVWHEADIRQWPITADLNAYVKGENLWLVTDLLKGVKGDGDTSGNPWVIARCPDGKLHAATWEWISYGRQFRPAWKLLDADHINVSAFDNVDKAPGTVVYVAVSGWARTAKRSAEIRTPFRKVLLP
ncbi:MAG: hypothetical protein K8T26_18620 [Lentisphaerae bacterium]|nr:hypothetical protein [Lentisphaerota bacterium]